MNHLRHHTRLLFSLVVIAAIAAIAAGCGKITNSSAGSPSASANTGVSGNVSVMGIWTGPEQKAFQKVIDGFTAQYPNVDVKYTSGGDNLATVLSTAVKGGNPPSMAFVGQPGLMQEFVKQGALKPIEYARDVVEQNFTKDIVDLGSVDGKLYGFVFKGANKSTVWYNVKAFQDAGIQPPQTWDELLQDAKTLKASGVPAYSIGGADGWTLTDLFENIYLRTAGPDKYDQLSKHEIPWTDPSVKTALDEMAKVFSDTSNIAGGTSGALQADFPKSVTQVFSDPPKAAMVFEGDFVQGEILASTKAQPGTDFNQFPFPGPQAGDKSVVTAGDTLITFRDDPATRAFVEYLATAQAAEIWAKIGGYSSPNKNVNTDVYEDPILRATATALADAETFRFDMSDLAPAAFGGTVGQGEWKILQDFLKNPQDVKGTQQALEQAAAKAFGK
jgi:alpha-glucoside transport system substrate-binding protein